MKSKIKVLLLIIFSLSVTSCKQKQITLTRIFDYVFDAGTYTKINYDYAHEYFLNNNSNWTNSYCTSIATVTRKGKTMVGHNLDGIISEHPAFIFRTKEKGYYQTINLAYTSNLGSTYNEIIEKNESQDFLKLLPFLATDVINEKGLFISVNSRNSDFYEDGHTVFGCDGTNPGAITRVCSLILPRYLSERCSTCYEAVRLAKTLDIYTLCNENEDYNYCFTISDATGNYGLLEIACNQVSWIPHQYGQANFYITEEFAEKERYPCGYERVAILMTGIKAVQNEQQMLRLMKKVCYSQKYNPQNAVFDIRDEYIKYYPHWTYDFVMDPDHQDEIWKIIDKYAKKYKKLTREEVQKANYYRETTLSVVANSTEKTLLVKFFEDNNKVVKLSF